MTVRSSLIAAGLGLVTLVSAVPVVAQTLVPAQSEISFVAKQLG
ncbi:MAG: hypothetical protein RLZZ369_1823, partial [Pseudomonadota bacterium]